MREDSQSISKDNGCTIAFGTTENPLEGWSRIGGVSSAVLKDPQRDSFKRRYLTLGKDDLKWKRHAGKFHRIANSH